MRDFAATLFDPVDIASLVVFRVLFGLATLWLMTYYYTDARIDLLSEKCFRFPFPGFGWVTPFDRDLMEFEIRALQFLSVCIIVGFLHRLSALVFFLGYAHILLTDVTYYQNHFYLVLLLALLLAVMPTHRSWSVDSLFRPAQRIGTTPKWTIFALRAQLTIVYLFAGLAKLNYDWLHGEPIRVLLELSPNGAPFRSEFSVYAMAYTGAIFDIIIGPALLWRRTRLAFYDICLVFHFVNSRIWDIDVFPYFMMGASLIYFDPGWPREIWARIRNRKPVGMRSEDAIPPGKANTGPFARRAVLFFLLVYFTIQIALPLRHTLYPGNVLWTDEGRLLGWRMLIARHVSVMRFYARDPASGERWELDLREFGLRHNLNRLPERMLPYNAVVFAHHAADVLGDQGHDNVEIYAEIWTSLHRRKPQQLLDPTVNLAAVAPTSLTKPWILPLTEPLPKTAADRKVALQAWLALGGSREQW